MLNLRLKLVQPSAGFFLRHLIAYAIVLSIYFIPPLFLNPTGKLFFLSVVAWSWICKKCYIKFVMLRCATKLAWIESVVIGSAIIAYILHYKFAIDWFFYENIEQIAFSCFIAELILITISLMGGIIGIWRDYRYNQRKLSHSHHGADSIGRLVHDNQGSL